MQTGSIDGRDRRHAKCYLCHTARSPKSSTVSLETTTLTDSKHSLFRQLRAGLEQEAVECRVLVGEVRCCGGTLQIQAADDDVEHRGNGRQLHAVKHGRHLRGDGVQVRLVGAHDYAEKPKRRHV